jgi:hypothetical protein
MSDALSIASTIPPARLASLVFAAKVNVLRVRRAAGELGARPPRLTREAAFAAPVLVAESRSALWPDPHPAERQWQLGKVANLRVACRALDQLVLPAGTVFSLWRQLGPPVRARGYVRGRMLQQGCVVASVGGGLCQLSNALYQVALQAGCRIVERHAHSRVVPFPAAEAGQDATVAWNYVDLRFIAGQTLRLTAHLAPDHLVVRLYGTEAAAPVQALQPQAPRTAARSCGTCNETGCFRHEGAIPAAGASPQVFLADEAWPEFHAYVHSVRREQDWLGLPLDGERWRLKRYAWRKAGFARVSSAPLRAIGRARALRRAGGQGPARRNAEMEGAGRIAAALARLLRPEVTEVTAAQSYLPFLWRDGHLGGRRFTVLMHRMPMAALQAILDAGAASRPERASLADFRAPGWLVAAETEALAHAARIVTPHTAIAALFPGRAALLDWQKPPAGDAVAGAMPFIAFPGPTIARKGAHAVREAARALGLAVMPLGAELEGADFWRGVTRAAGDWRQALAVVQPALVEDQPRRLLAALAAGVPVIATQACGLAPQPGLSLIAPDDADGLIEALRGLLGR